MKNNILILGEFMTHKDYEEGYIFAGGSGWMLKTLMNYVGLSFNECHKTYVFLQMPQKGELAGFCGKKDEGVKGLPALSRAGYMLPKYQHELDRLYAEINRMDPNVILALGPAASWALLGTTGLKAIRGAPAASTAPQLKRPYKVIPTYSPNAVNRDYSLRPIVLSDLDKLRRESGYPEVVRPSRKIWLEPTLGDLYEYEREFIHHSNQLSIDIETKGRIITCIGFAPDKHSAIVVPFFSERRKDNNYWSTLHEEVEAWNWVRRMCALKKAVGQNFIYDMNFLWTEYGITVPKASDDTMLLHHALQLEMPKALGFLATLYTDEASWKFMRKNDTIKKED